MTCKVCVMTSAHPAFDVRIFHKECNTLSRAGYEVTLIAPHHTSRLTEDGVKLLAVRSARSRIQRFFRTTLAVYRLARRTRADLYHFHDPELIPAGLFLRAQGHRVVYDIHEDLPRTLSYKPYIPAWFVGTLEKVVDFLERTVAKGFSALVAATPEIARRFQSHPRVAVVQNYPRLEEFQTSPRAQGASAAYVVYVGLRITRARGAAEMVRAMGLLPEASPIRLKLAGNIEPPELLDELKALDGWKRTDYLGLLDRKDISALIQGATAGLVVLHPEPNYLNAHPVKLFEYMCAGVPVIASDFPVCRQIVQPSGCGLLVDPKNPHEIASAITFLCNGSERAAQMGNRGRDAVLARYNWGAEGKTLLDLYRRVCRTPLLYDELKAETT